VKRRHVIFAPFITAFGGVERLILQLSNFLHREGKAHTIVTFSNSAELQRFADRPIEIVELKGPRGTMSEMRRLRAWLKVNAGTDTVLPILVFDLRGALYAAPAGVPFVVHLTDPPSLLPADISKFSSAVRASGYSTGDRGPDMPTRIRGELTHVANKASLRRAAKVIAMTNRIASEVRALYQVDATIVRPGVEIPETTPAPFPAGDSIEFLSISRLVATKRVDWILEAVAALERSFAAEALSFRLTVAGEGPLRRDLEQTSVALGIEDRVEWLGEVSENELDRIYGDPCVFLMPAAQGWGLPAAEALVRRHPVVVHNASGIAEILDRSPWVEIAQGDSAEDFTAAVGRMVDRVRDTSVAWGDPPRLPSHDEWAAQICDVCSWTNVTGAGSVA
jgi:glycosyltransferase involved in cell wall biosynthesis